MNDQVWEASSAPMQSVLRAQQKGVSKAYQGGRATWGQGRASSLLESSTPMESRARGDKATAVLSAPCPLWPPKQDSFVYKELASSQPERFQSTTARRAHDSGTRAFAREGSAGTGTVAAAQRVCTQLWRSTERRKKTPTEKLCSRGAGKGGPAAQAPARLGRPVGNTRAARCSRGRHGAHTGATRANSAVSIRCAFRYKGGGTPRGCARRAPLQNRHPATGGGAACQRARSPVASPAKSRPQRPGRSISARTLQELSRAVFCLIVGR